jgi:hypothetical protein
VPTGNNGNAISASGAQNVRILGPGLITNGGANVFGDGVFFSDMHHSEVSGITVLGSIFQGIFVLGGIGTPPSDFLTITGNTVGQNGLRLDFLGMELHVVSSTISENDVSGNSRGLGISNPTSGSPNIVNHNICNGNVFSGLGVGGPATVKNNVTNGNGQLGLGVSGPNVEVSNNTSLANGNVDMSDSSAVCAGTVWSGKTFFTANQSCIH